MVVVAGNCNSGVVGMGNGVVAEGGVELWLGKSWGWQRMDLWWWRMDNEEGNGETQTPVRGEE